MPSSSVDSQVTVWGTLKLERPDGLVYYQSAAELYNTNNKLRSIWEYLRCKYCMISRNDNLSEQYRLGLPVPRNLVFANIVLLSKIILKEVTKWLKELF